MIVFEKALYANSNLPSNPIVDFTVEHKILDFAISSLALSRTTMRFYTITALHFRPVTETTGWYCVPSNVLTP
ncbi:hypothetical protein RRG08_033527 [Elysia crispata]|uniref:Uncharacterized protein n=1 Tax=Elysia crispata TaxID=231223 RepID=A0AAE0XPW0_9GAST|nr:hypothetical protein RRG08_033527 [Elysia crispata]